MKKILLLSTAFISLSLPVFAQETSYQSTSPAETIVPAAMTEAVAPDPAMEEIKALQDKWAHIKYQITDKDNQLEAIHALEAKAEQVTARYPNRAEPKIWEAIILSTDAGIVKGMSALGKVEKARDLLQASLQIDPRALDGSAHTSLGSLYYQVPGWPIGFGDDEEAEKQLKQALAINPTGIDPNYFYGDFLLQDGRADEAKAYLERALQAPAREGRELADMGRKQEIRAALAKVEEKAKTQSVKHYN